MIEDPGTEAALREMTEALFLTPEQRQPRIPDRKFEGSEILRLTEEEFQALQQPQRPKPAIITHAPQATEAQEQAALIAWAHLREFTIPELRMLFHIPNGGHRPIREAVKLKRMGTRPGIPDLFLAIARGGFHGLWIEMKTTKGKLSKEQRRMMSRLESEGYRVVLCRTWVEAQTVILKYLGV